MSLHPTRRDFLALGGASAITVWLGTDPRAFKRALDATRSAAEGHPVQFEVLTAEQAEDLEAIAAQIIPSDDDVPGAREAKAIVFIDRSLASFASGQLDQILEGLAELNGRVVARGGEATRFAQLRADDQVTLLIEIEDTPFFWRVRSSTLVGTFAHPNWGGNHEGTGYEILGFDPRFIWQPPFGEYDAEVRG